MSIYHLETMTWNELNELNREKTVFFLPVSPIEQHGTHLPLGTDFFGAVDMTKLAVEMLEKSDNSLNYVIMPGLPCGCTEGTKHFPGTLSLRMETLKNLLIDICSCVASHKFNKLILINHHLDLVHVKAILEAIKEVKTKYQIEIIESASVLFYSDMQIKDELLEKMDCYSRNEIHADVKETSFIMYKYPELLRKNYKELNPVYIDIENEIRMGKKYFEEMGAIQGYIGSPAKANLKYGEYHLKTGAKHVADLCMKLYRGEEIPQISHRMQYVLDNFIH